MDGFISMGFISRADNKQVQANFTMYMYLPVQHFQDTIAIYWF